MFKSASQAGWAELDDRKRGRKRLTFGVDYLDDATYGISENDLILLGARTGSGKTQLCTGIALANIAEGRRVHYLALEASRFEIERRMKYPLVIQQLLADDNRKIKYISYQQWVSGQFVSEMHEHENRVADFFEKAYRDLFIFYKEEKFGIDELLRSVAVCSDKTDLIIVDHIHYFDWDDDNDNRAIKNIAKIARKLSLDEEKPIILVAHMRKKDRGDSALVADLEEFHGSSELAKIATKAITMSPGKPTSSGNYETFFRVVKNRDDNGCTRYVGREFFSPKKGWYEKGKYDIGWAHKQKLGSDFEPLVGVEPPEWSRTRMGGDRETIPRMSGCVNDQTRPRYVPGGD